MFLIAGLGNPGPKYELTRHNIGFLFIDYLSLELGESPNNFKDKFGASILQTKLDNQDIILAKPQNYMNNSGKAISEISKFYKILPKNTIVIHDELDIDFGQIKQKQGGGHAGHNGLRDIDNFIGKNYHRLRLGITHPRNSETPQIEPADYVLQKFSNTQQESLQKIFKEALEKLKKTLTL